MNRLASESEQATAEAIGAQIRELITPYVLTFAPPGIDKGTMTLSVASAAIQALALAEGDSDGNRINFVHGVGIALGIMHAQFCSGGSGAIVVAMNKGFAKGYTETLAALQPQGRV